MTAAVYLMMAAVDLMMATVDLMMATVDLMMAAVDLMVAADNFHLRCVRAACLSYVSCSLLHRATTTIVCDRTC